MQRIVFMFAYYFPPCTCYPTASARAAGLARHLPAFGWDPVVITRDFGAMPCRCQRDQADRSPATTGPNIEGVSTVRVGVRKSRLRSARDALALHQSGNSIRPLRVFLRRTASAILSVTDHHDTWVEDATGAGTDLMSSVIPDAIWTTSGPHRSIRIGRQFARQWQVPWIADLRDAISRLPNSDTKLAVPSYLRRRRFLVDLKDAATLVEVTPQEGVRDRRWLPRAAFEVIPSGFDADGWAAVHRSATRESERLADRYVIAYTGHIVPKQDPGLFFKGLRRFVDIVSNDLEVRVDYFGPSGVAFGEAARTANLQALIRDHGKVSAERARVAMAEADTVVLLTYPGVSGIPGGKLYDYLASTTPILVVPGGDEYVAELISQSSAGLEASTPEEICNALQALMDAPDHDRDAIFAQRAKAHGWEDRARRLARILDEVSA